MPIQLQPEVGAFTREPRVENPFLKDPAFNSLAVDDEKGLGFDVTEADALEVFPEISEKDENDKYTKRAATGVEALEKYLALLGRQLTEAGAARKPPVTIRRNLSENEDGSVHVFFKARPKVERKSTD